MTANTRTATRYEIDYATGDTNTATLAKTYRSESAALIAARKLADALTCTTIVYGVEKTFGLSVRSRVAVIVETSRFDWAEA